MTSAEAREARRLLRVLEGRGPARCMACSPKLRKDYPAWVEDRNGGMVDGRAANQPMVCTLPEDHPGPHVGTSNHESGPERVKGVVYATWEEKEEADACPDP